MDKQAAHAARRDKFAQLPKGTLLRVNPKIDNAVVSTLLSNGDCLFLFDGVSNSPAFPVHANSLINGWHEVFAVDELLLPGEEPG